AFVRALRSPRRLGPRPRAGHRHSRRPRPHKGSIPRSRMRCARLRRKRTSVVDSWLPSRIRRWRGHRAAFWRVDQPWTDSQGQAGRVVEFGDALSVVAELRLPNHVGEERQTLNRAHYRRVGDVVTTRHGDGTTTAIDHHPSGAFEFADEALPT